MKHKTQQNAANLNTEEILVVEESKGKRIFNAVVNCLLVIAIVLAAICTYVSFVATSGSGVPSILGIRIFSIQTESMYPTLLPAISLLTGPSSTVSGFSIPIPFTRSTTVADI